MVLQTRAGTSEPRHPVRQSASSLLAIRKRADIADKLVPLERGSDLVGLRFLVGTCLSGHGVRALCAHDFAHTAEIHRLRTIVIQRDDVLNRTAQVRLLSGGEEHPTGTD